MHDFLRGAGHLGTNKKDKNLMNIQSMNMNMNRPSQFVSNKGHQRCKTGQYRQRNDIKNSTLEEPDFKQHLNEETFINLNTSHVSSNR